MKTSLRTKLIYLFRYLEDGLTRSAMIYPVDAANGCIMDEVPGTDGLMRALTTSGKELRVNLEHIVSFAIFDVHWRNNQGTQNNSKWDEKTLSEHFEAGTDPKTGEVHTPLRSIQVNGKEVYRQETEDRVSQKPKP